MALGWAGPVSCTRMLSHSDGLKGTMTSNLDKIALVLMAGGSHDCLPPFISLDEPWCLDRNVASCGTSTYASGLGMTA